MLVLLTKYFTCAHHVSRSRKGWDWKGVHLFVRLLLVLISLRVDATLFLHAC